jgi:hypothetical protein
MQKLDKKLVLSLLRGLWKHTDPAYRLVGIEALRYSLVSLDADVARDVTACLKNSGGAVRRAFLDMLWGRKLRFPALLPVVKGLLRDKDQGVRMLAGYWVAWMGDGAAIPVLREILASGNVLQRREVVGLFRGLKQESSSLLSDAQAILAKEKDVSVVTTLLYSLAEWGERAAGLRAALEPYAAGMGTRSLYRYPTIRLLGRIGKQASWAVPYLWPLAAKEYNVGASNFIYFAEALGRIGTSTLSKVLADLR